MYKSDSIYVGPWLFNPWFDLYFPQDVMIELYKRNVWHDAKTVNVIVTACFSKVAKVRTLSLSVFHF